MSAGILPPAEVGIVGKLRPSGKAGSCLPGPSSIQHAVESLPAACAARANDELPLRSCYMQLAYRQDRRKKAVSTYEQSFSHRPGPETGATAYLSKLGFRSFGWVWLCIFSTYCPCGAPSAPAKERRKPHWPLAEALGPSRLRPVEFAGTLAPIRTQIHLSSAPTVMASSWF